MHDTDCGIAPDGRGHVVSQAGKSLGANLLFLKREERDRREVCNCLFIRNLGSALYLCIIVIQRYVSKRVVHVRALNVKG